MSLDKVLKNLIIQKKELTRSLEVCCDSIGFWEERAEKIFTKMDQAEEEYIFAFGDSQDQKLMDLQQESEKLMKRIEFENNQLDLLEAQVLELEENIITTLARYAKKQKK